MKTIIYILAILLLPNLLPGQESLVIRGQVKEAVSNIPLSDSHVYISCRHQGTITDKEGNFYLEVPRCCMTQCLIISYMGYQKYIVPIHEIAKKELDIQLDYGVITLAELVITPDHYWIIYQSQYEPYKSGDMEVFIAGDEYIQAMVQKKPAKIHAMF